MLSRAAEEASLLPPIPQVALDQAVLNEVVLDQLVLDQVILDKVTQSNGEVK
jgi:hypothetical protein